MLKGRLGLDSARIPQVDRHGLMWLGRGNLFVEDGTLHFATAGFDSLGPGDYALPFQMLTCILLQPGTTVTHDALRLLAAQGTGLVVVGEDAVRFYASLPQGPDSSARARRQAAAWADAGGERLAVARRMYALRLGEVFPDAEISVLRGIEGARMKEMYVRFARQYGIEWRGRRYDRKHPEAADAPNQAINHASSAILAIAEVAVAVTGTLPALGFIHEDSGLSFSLDVADLFRDSVILPVAFGALREARRPGEPLERVVRRLAGSTCRQRGTVGQMIDRIKGLLDVDDRSSDPQCP